MNIFTNKSLDSILGNLKSTIASLEQFSIKARGDAAKAGEEAGALFAKEYDLNEKAKQADRVAAKVAELIA